MHVPASTNNLAFNAVHRLQSITDRLAKLGLRLSLNIINSPLCRQYHPIHSNLVQSIHPEQWSRTNKPMVVNHHDTLLLYIENNLHNWHYLPIRDIVFDSLFPSKRAILINWLTLIQTRIDEVILGPKYVVATDGSVSDQRAGCAVVTASHSYASRLPNGCNSFEAEMAAISLALQLIPTFDVPQNHRTIVIISDCQSALRKPPCLSPDSYFFWSKIIDILDTFRLYFVWVPSHVGFPPNERADEVAKWALNDPQPEVIPPVLMLPSLLCPRLERRDRGRQLQRLYLNLPENHARLQHLCPLRGSGPFRDSSLEFAWLRFSVNRPPYFIKGRRITSYTGFCINCPTIPQSAHHTFYECPKYQIAREKLLEDLCEILSLQVIPLTVIYTCGNCVNPAWVADTASAISTFFNDMFS